MLLFLTGTALSAMETSNPKNLAESDSILDTNEPAFLTSGRPALRILYTANTRGALHPCPS